MAYSLLPGRCGSRLSTIAGVCLAAVVLAGGGGCFTDSINKPPMVSINPPDPYPVWRGQRATFTATASDPNGDVPSLEWAKSPTCPSTNDQDPTTWPAVRVGGQSYLVEGADTVAPFCVWVLATDRQGATAHNTWPVTPMNHPPVAVIEVVDPTYATPDEFSLYAPLTFSGAQSIDAEMDTKSYEWMLTKRPLGSRPELAFLADCPATPGPEFTCLMPDLPGTYEVQLKVRDAEGSTMARVTVRVAGDQLPCVATTMPAMDASTLVPNPEEGIDFRVTSVTDDGDAYPVPATTHFQWFVGKGTDPLEYRGNEMFSSFFVPPKAYALGDDVRVRVEIYDRQPDAVNRVLAGCGDDAPLCAGRPGCFQRVTWRIQYR